MDERSFIEDKQQSWKDLSDSIELIRRRGLRSISREKLASLGARYRAIVSDLSFARTQGASDDLVSYLNELAGRAHGVLYASPGAKAGGMSTFLTKEFPILFRSTFRYTLTAMLIFFIAWGAAAYLILTDPSIGKQLVPDIPTSKDAPQSAEIPIPDPASMSSFIMTNNIKVGILSFAGGITAGLITVFEMAQNGLVIGAVATAAAPVMGPARFWSYILPHGVIELMAIFICGGAGLMIGSAMIAPGNLRRADAIRTAAGKAVRLFAGTVVFFVVAGIIEGFITPSVIPVWSKLAFAGFTGIVLVMYLGFGGTGDL